MKTPIKIWVYGSACFLSYLELVILSWWLMPLIASISAIIAVGKVAYKERDEEIKIAPILSALALIGVMFIWALFFLGRLAMEAMGAV